MLLLLVVVFAFVVVLPATGAACYAITSRPERALQRRAAAVKVRAAELELEAREHELIDQRHRRAITAAKERGPFAREP